MREKRCLGAAVEVREAGEGKRFFVGRAAEYGVWSDLLFGSFREQLAPGVFDDSLKRTGRDVIATVGHDETKIIGRESAGTLVITPDERGLSVEVPVSAYTYAADLAEAIRRGDLRGMSFIFDVVDDKWESRDGVPHRTVTKADIYEVSFVHFPAYPQTEAGFRAAGAGGEEEARRMVYERFERPRQMRRIRLAEAEKS